jgi:hypothetical protein
VVILGESTLNGLLHPCAVRLAVSWVFHGDSRLPEHNTAKVIVFLVGFNQIVRIFRLEVVRLLTGKAIRASGQTNVKFCVGVCRGLDLGDPFVECEGTRVLVLHIPDGLGSRAGLGVVELSEDHIKRHLLKNGRDPDVWDDTLRSGGEEEVRLGLDVLAEGVIVLVNVLRRRHVVGFCFEIEVKSVYKRVTERTRLVGRLPLRGGFAIGSNQELCEPLGDIRARQIVVCWCATTEGEHDLLTPPVASINGFLHARTVTVKSTVTVGSRVFVYRVATGIGMVASWVCASRLGECVDDFSFGSVSIAS